MADFEPAATTFSATNALFLAEASQAAYRAEAGAQAKMAQLGLLRDRRVRIRGSDKVFESAHEKIPRCDALAGRRRELRQS
jgi:hypothetical protein